MSLLFGPNTDQLLYCPAATLGPYMTFAGWFYPITMGEAGAGSLIWHESSGTDARPRVGMYWNPSGQVEMFSDFSGTDAQAITGTVVAALNTWVWIGMTWTISPPTAPPSFAARIGDDWRTWPGTAGVVYTAPTGSPIGPNNGDGYNIRIGNNNRFDRCFHGYIAETYVWRQNMTFEQMRTIAFEGPSSLLQNIHFWYNPNEPLTPTGGGFSTTPDRSGNGRTGVAINNPIYTAIEPPPSVGTGWGATEILDIYVG